MNGILIWVPAHFGLVGNEVVDHLAKDGLGHGAVVDKIMHICFKRTVVILSDKCCLHRKVSKHFNVFMKGCRSLLFVNILLYA